MLKNIPPILSPALMLSIMEMGHGDEIVLADGNYPVESTATISVRADGHGIPELLEAILKFFPLDQQAINNVFFMKKDEKEKPSIWQKYQTILDNSQEKYAIEKLDRFQFYERAREAYTIVATGEKTLYANIILRKIILNVSD